MADISGKCFFFTLQHNTHINILLLEFLQNILSFNYFYVILKNTIPDHSLSITTNFLLKWNELNKVNFRPIPFI